MSQDERIVAGKVKGKQLKVVEKLHDMGYTDTEIVRQGIRLVARQAKVPA